MARPVEIADVLQTDSDCRLVAIRAGEYLFREGDAAHSLYIVKSGMLRIVRGNAVLERLKPGGIVGEMAIIEEGAPRSASVIAGTYAELLEVDTRKFLSLVAEVPAFSLAVMRVMARRIRVMNQRYRPGALGESVAV